MKILQVTESFMPMWESGGVARSSYEISKELVKRGHTVMVYTINRSKSYGIRDNDIINSDDLSIYYFGMNKIQIINKLLGIIPSVRASTIIKETIQDYNIIHIHDYRSILTLIVVHYARKYNIPYVIQARGALPKMGKSYLKFTFDLIFGKRVLRNSAKAIALQQMEYRQFLDIGLPSSQVEIISNGINVDVYQHLPDKGLFRFEQNINYDTKIILFLGRIDPIKGIDILIDAMSLLLQEMDDIVLVIAGPDGSGYLTSIKERIEHIGIYHKVIIPGPIYGEKKIQAYVDADVYVQPSIYDCFPNSVFEACACGTPVILTNECGISDLIDNNAGISISRNKYKLAAALKSILTDSQLAKKYGEQGRRMVLENYSFDTVVTKIEECYATCVTPLNDIK